MSLTTGRGVDYVGQYAAAAEHFAIDIARSDMRAAVPTCPGWSTYDLVVHLGNVHAWAATIVETGHAAAEQNDEPRSHKPRVASQWYAAKAEDLYAVLRAAHPDAPCWNFVGSGRSKQFWSRRQMHETLMHHVDLDGSAGRTTDVAAGLCADGIGETLTVFLPRMHARGFPSSLESPLLLRATDTSHTWTLVPQGGLPPRVEERLLPGADRIEAPAGVLLRVLWKRLPADDPALTFTGDRARIDAFLASRLTP